MTNPRDIGVGHGGNEVDRMTHLHLHLFQRGPRRPRRHFHLFALHRHPDWHGHCRARSADSGTVATFHLLRGHSGEALLCDKCRADASDLVSHSCDRLHFHGPFRHRHTLSGR